MNVRELNFELLEDEERSKSFEDLMRVVEIIALSGGMRENLLKAKIEEYVLQIERTAIRLKEIQAPELKLIYDKTIYLVDSIQNILVLKPTTQSLELTIGYLSALHLLTSYLFNINLKKHPNVIDKITFEIFKWYFDIRSSSVETTTVSGFIKSIMDGKQIFPSTIKPNQNEWTCEILLSSKNENNSLYFLWLLIDIISRIEGVKIKMDDIKSGSILAKLKLLFNNIKAKNDVIDLLNSTRKYAEGILEKDFELKEKSKKETEKIVAEKDKILFDIDNAKRKLELELLSLELDVEKKKLENEKMQLDIFSAKKNLYSQLLAENIINVEEFSLAINKQPLLIKDRNKFLIEPINISND